MFRAAPPPAKLPTDDEFNTGLKRLMGLVRDLRERVSTIDRAMKSVADAAALQSSSARASEIESAYKKTHNTFTRNKEAIDEIFGALRDLIRSSARIHNGWGDMVTRLSSLWDAAAGEWRDKVTDVDEIARMAAKTKSALPPVIREAAYLTIPPRLNEYLAEERVGGTVDFNAAFKDEVEDEAQRKEILKWIAASPGSIDGIVELDAGNVIRFDPNPRRQAMSLAAVAVLTLVGFVIPIGLANLGSWLTVQGWPFSPDKAHLYLAAYIFLLVGAVIHLGVDMVKQARGDRSGFTAIEDFTLWAHVNEAQLIKSVFFLWVALVGIVGAAASTNTVLDWFTLVAAGYTVDSVADIFLQKFDSKAKQASKTFTSTLEAAAPAAARA